MNQASQIDIFNSPITPTKMTFDIADERPPEDLEAESDKRTPQDKKRTSQVRQLDLSYRAPSGSSHTRRSLRNSSEILSSTTGLHSSQPTVEDDPSVVSTTTSGRNRSHTIAASSSSSSSVSQNAKQPTMQSSSSGSNSGGFLRPFRATRKRASP
jgi:hypothetical protein